MTKASDFVIPLIVIFIIGFGLFKGTDVFSAFLDGAKSGFKTVVEITPSLIALITVIEMLRMSGALEVLAAFTAPVTKLLGIPEELTPLTLLSPVSGSGSLGMFESILKDYGPDSLVGRAASIMMGSTETTFYTMTVYYGSIGIKKTRHTLPAALCADFTSFILSPRIVRLFFPQ